METIFVEENMIALTCDLPKDFNVRAKQAFEKHMEARTKGIPGIIQTAVTGTNTTTLTIMTIEKYSKQYKDVIELLIIDTRKAMAVEKAQKSGERPGMNLGM